MRRADPIDEEDTDDEKNKKDIWPIIGFIILGSLVSLFLSKFPIYARDFLTLLFTFTLFIITALAGIYFTGNKKIIFLCLSAFIFLHLIFFPFCYVYLLSKNPKSMQFDGFAFESSKLEAIQNLNSIYDIKDLTIKQGLLNNILTSKDKFYSIPISQLSRKDSLHCKCP